MDLEDIRLAAEAFEEEITGEISEQPDIIAYVERLEQRYDAATEQSPDIPSTDAMVKELEDFLESQRQRPDNAGGAQS